MCFEWRGLPRLSFVLGQGFVNHGQLHTEYCSNDQAAIFAGENGNMWKAYDIFNS